MGAPDLWAGRGSFAGAVLRGACDEPGLAAAEPRDGTVGASQRQPDERDDPCRIVAGRATTGAVDDPIDLIRGQAADGVGDLRVTLPRAR